MLRPDNFAKALERSIDELRNRIKDLEREAAPLEKGLADAKNELIRIERAWIRGRLSEEELRKLERDAQARSDRIRSQRDALDTGDLQDLEKTRDLIRSAEKSLDLACSAKDNWWSHPEAPPVWFTDVLTPPDWPNGEFANDPSPQSSVYDTFPPIDPSHISKTLNEALNRLHAEVYAKPDELEVRGVINVTVPPQEGPPIPGHLVRVDWNSDAQALAVGSTSSARTGGTIYLEPQ